MARFQDYIQQGIRADQPLATTVAEGTLYGVTDEGDIIERSDSSAWVAYSPSATGTIVQVVNTQTGSMSTGTTTIPLDDTIPQKTEGDEYMTRAITPTSATNKLKIDIVVNLSSGTADRWLIVALFQDTTADALAATTQYAATAGGEFQICFSHYMTSGTTSATTFKVRAGANAAGTTTFNGSVATARFGGVMASSITITEIAV